MGIADRVSRMQEKLEHLRATFVARMRGFSTIKEGLVHTSDFLSYEVRLVGTRPKLLACDKGGLTHCPLPFHVDQLKVAGPRCPYTLVNAARCLIFSSFFKRGLWRITRENALLVPSEPLFVVGTQLRDPINSKLT